MSDKCWTNNWYKTEKPLIYKGFLALKVIAPGFDKAYLFIPKHNYLYQKYLF